MSYKCIFCGFEADSALDHGSMQCRQTLHARIADLEARIDTAIKYGNVECLVHAKNQDRAALREDG